RAGFSRALQEALSNRELREAKAARALETARQHEWNRVASSFLDLYAALTHSAPDSIETFPAPAFSSVPASGPQSLLTRTVSAAAERTFYFLSKLSNHRAASTRARG
ncbi:MAG: hypothetical protein J2P13_03840, partial [Acidobacteria bacterium]|nr:hypothetical protein [Acidobacteriota bacterium]